MAAKPIVYLTIEQVAARVGRSARTVRLWCERGTLPSRRMGERVLMIDQVALKGFVPPQLGRKKTKPQVA